ncbi:MAG: hypothetical protein IKT31_11585 [Firmicutes bacterium]|nr:hypothetical protein [Bacillota bacterium]
MVKLPLILSIVWFFIAGLSSVLLTKSFSSGDMTTILMLGLVLAVALFAALSNLRLYLKRKGK